MTSPRAIQTRSPRTGCALLVLLAFVVFSLMKSIFILVGHAGPDSGDMATDRNLHFIAYQAVANIAFTVGAALALAGLLDRSPGRSRRLVMGATIATAAGFALLFVEAQTVPPLLGSAGTRRPTSGWHAAWLVHGVAPLALFVHTVTS